MNSKQFKKFEKNPNKYSLKNVYLWDRVYRENSCVLDLECLGRRDCRKCALIHDPAAVQGVRDLANARAIVNNNKGARSGSTWTIRILLRSGQISMRRQ